MVEKTVSTMTAYWEAWLNFFTTAVLHTATRAVEQTTIHRRMMEISTDHAHDLTPAFQHLMKAGFLESHSYGRGTEYHLPGQSLPSADQAFSQSMVISIADKTLVTIAWDITSLAWDITSVIHWGG